MLSVKQRYFVSADICLKNSLCLSKNQAGGEKFVWLTMIQFRVIMNEGLVEVVVDEALPEKSGESYLKVEVYIDGVVGIRMAFQRNASPQKISNELNETGCLIKYEEGIELSEEDRQEIGDLHIEASYNVPGLKER